MSNQRFPLKEFSAEDIRNLSATMKVGILGTVTPEGLPHITLITTLMACSPTGMVWGQFMEGFSKQYIRQNPKTGFLIMGLDKNMWRGRADYTRSGKDGKDYDFYNNTPLFRYNSYFGVHTVHYMNLVAHDGKHPLPMNQVILAAIKTMIAKFFSVKQEKTAVLNTWSTAFYNKIDNLKFLGYVDADGYPVIIPLIQAQSLDREYMIFSFGAYGEELAQIPAYTPVAIFGMSLSMEDVLVRGTYQGARRVAGIKSGMVQLDFVYNPMPPVPAQIYPDVPVQSVVEF